MNVIPEGYPSPPPPYVPQYVSNARAFGSPPPYPQQTQPSQGYEQYPVGYDGLPLGSAAPRTITILAYEPARRGCRCGHVLIAILVCIAVLVAVSEVMKAVPHTVPATSLHGEVGNNNLSPAGTTFWH